MPNNDRTGPEGKGSQTGRGAGYCNNKNVDTEPRYQRKGMGFGRGHGKGRGLGYRSNMNESERYQNAGMGRGRGGPGKGPCAYDLESEVDSPIEKSNFEIKLDELTAENEILKERLKKLEDKK